MAPSRLTRPYLRSKDVITPRLRVHSGKRRRWRAQSPSEYRFDKFRLSRVAHPQSKAETQRTNETLDGRAPVHGGASDGRGTMMHRYPPPIEDGNPGQIVRTLTGRTRSKLPASTGAAIALWRYLRAEIHSLYLSHSLSGCFSLL